jgi:TonB family protein
MKKSKRVFCSVVLLAATMAVADEADRKVKTRVDPEYPEIASKMNLHGAVRLKVWIAQDGTVERVEYIGGHPLLAESAVKAVKRWIYERASRESTVAVEIKF